MISGTTADGCKTLKPHLYTLDLSTYKLLLTLMSLLSKVLLDQNVWLELRLDQSLVLLLKTSALHVHHWQVLAVSCWAERVHLHLQQVLL